MPSSLDRRVSIQDERFFRILPNKLLNMRIGVERRSVDGEENINRFQAQPVGRHARFYRADEDLVWDGTIPKRRLVGSGIEVRGMGTIDLLTVPQDGRR